MRLETGHNDELSRLRFVIKFLKNNIKIKRAQLCGALV